MYDRCQQWLVSGVRGVSGGVGFCRAAPVALNLRPDVFCVATLAGEGYGHLRVINTTIIQQEAVLFWKGRLENIVRLCKRFPISF